MLPNLLFLYKFTITGTNFLAFFNFFYITFSQKNVPNADPDSQLWFEGRIDFYDNKCKTVTMTGFFL